MLKKPNILVVGSFMMDLIASTKRAPSSGETVVGLKFQTAPGGKGANQAVQCARLGAHVTMVGQVGNDAFGRIMTDTAKSAGVDVSHVSVDLEESSGVGHITLEVTEHGAQNRITVCPGANFTLTVEDIAWLKDEIHAYDLVMMQFELPMPVIEAVAQWAHETGVKVMINPAPAAPMSAHLLSCSSYLSPNEHEAAILANHTIRVDNGVNMEDVRIVADAFHAHKPLWTAELDLTILRKLHDAARQKGTDAREDVASALHAPSERHEPLETVGFLRGHREGFRNEDSLRKARGERREDERQTVEEVNGTNKGGNRKRDADREVRTKPRERGLRHV